MRATIGKRHRSVLLSLLLAVAILIGCGPLAPAPEPTATPEPPPPTPTAAATPTKPPPTPTPTPEPIAVWLHPAVPGELERLVDEALAGLPTREAASPEDATLHLGIGVGEPVAEWVYVLVTPFPSLADDIPWSEVLAFWAGETPSPGDLAENAGEATLFVTDEIYALLAHILGEPADDIPIEVLAEEELLSAAWAARPGAWAVVPFHRLQTHWKVLTVDGANPLDRAFAPADYPLTVTFGMEMAADGVDAVHLGTQEAPLTNRDPERMTVLMMTGVTALVRATAAKMEEMGVLYPGLEIRDLLRSADLLHISNEIPFAENCPPPNPADRSLVFCSSPRYIELLRDISTDLIELTGNHFQDYGSAATLMTLEMYREEGWPYFGGGADLAEAKRSITIEHNGNRLAFIGCNPVGPAFAWATDERPGAAPCDYDYIDAELRRLRGEVHVPIMTWQYWEFYHYEPTPQQQFDFRARVDAGARIVSGSQAHHPQAIELYGEGFINYGLGNLFFDQMRTLGTRQGMVARHVIYDGRHISTQLHTYLVHDFAQPRFTSREERRQLLSAVYRASGW